MIHGGGRRGGMSFSVDWAIKRRRWIRFERWISSLCLLFCLGLYRGVSILLFMLGDTIDKGRICREFVLYLNLYLYL